MGCIGGCRVQGTSGPERTMGGLVAVDLVVGGRLSAAGPHMSPRNTSEERGHSRCYVSYRGIHFVSHVHRTLYAG